MGSNSLTMMEGSEAFGGGKVGGSFDPLNFLKKPCVVFRIAALLFSVIAFGCISSKAWQFEPEKDKEVCIMNDSSTACQLEMESPSLPSSPPSVFLSANIF